MAADTSERGLAIHDPKQSLEVLRTIQSLDPCIACAVHLTDEEGERIRSRWFERCGRCGESSLRLHSARYGPMLTVSSARDFEVVIWMQ